MANFIWVTAQKELLHRYPDAPRAVSFLRNEHRHNFHFKVFIEVFHEDRDIEFILFQRYIKGLLFNVEKNINHFSCEMLSHYLYGQIVDKYPNRYIKIEVSEDGENGVLYDYPVVENGTKDNSQTASTSRKNSKGETKTKAS